MDNKNLEIKSDDVQEILGTPPSWLVQWGTILMALVLLGLTLVFWKLEYPDEVRGELVLQTSNPPEPVLTKIDGMIAELFVQNGQKVQVGDELLVVQSQANFNHILQLERMLDSLQTTRSNGLEFFQLPKNLILGDLQEAFAKLKTSLKNYQESNKQSVDGLRIENINRKILQLEREIDNLGSELETAIEQKKVRENTRASLKKDYPNGGTKLVDLEKAWDSILEIERVIKKNNASIDSKKGEIESWKSSIGEIKKNARVGNQGQLSFLNQNLEFLSQEIKNWRKTYVLKSPFNGPIVLKDYYDQKKYYTSGKPVLSISTSSSHEILAYATIPVENTDKIKEGQKAHLHLTVFSSIDYGYLTGTVLNKKTQYQEGNCLVQIQLDNGMTSSKGQDLIFEPNMIGQVEIITEERNVLERLFGKASQLLF